MSGIPIWLDVWVHRVPNAAALMSTLLHSLWEGAVVALGLSVVLVFVRSSRLRYAANCVALVALVAGLVVTFTQLVPARPEDMRVSGLVRTVAPGGVIRANWVAVPTGAARVVDPMAWILPLWMVGVFVFYLRAMAGWISAVRIRKRGVCSAPEVWRARAEQLGARLRMSRPVALLESSIAEVPVVVGYLRPVILMPVGLLAGLPVSQVEAILLHELAHIRRFDSLVNLAQVFVEGLLFYHPAVWWISSVIRAERENCCDEVVVSMTGAPHELAKALTALEQRRVFPRETFLAATGSRLVNRISRLLGRPQARYAGAAPFMAMAVLTVAAISATAGLQPEIRVPAPPVTIAKTAAVPVPVKPLPVLIAQAPPAPTQPKAAPSPKPAVVPPAPSGDSPELPLYRLGAQDVLQVLVVDQPHISGTYRVSAEGDLIFPLINRIHVGGLSIPEVQNEIVHQLIEAVGISQPVVNVQLLRSNTPIQIKVIGDVKIPGQFDISSPITLYEALAKAGWTTVDAGNDVLVAKPGSDAPQKISLDDLQKNENDPTINLILTGGEAIDVPDAPKVWVTGNVTHPTGVLINKKEDATVLNVIARVEGLTQYYAKMAYVYRVQDKGARSEIPIPLKDIMHRKAQDVRLQAGDILLIPDENDALRRQFLQQLQEKNPQYRLQPPQYYDTKPVPLWLLEKAK